MLPDFRPDCANRRITDQAENALYVRDGVADAAAVAFPLEQTAAQHLPSLMAIATPGPFSFLGELPRSLREAIEDMPLNAEFAAHAAGFER